MSRQQRTSLHRAEPFICENCKQYVPLPISGTKHRNHCPHCLWSRHVDLRTGDRRSGCKGLMEPIAIWVLRRGEWALVHRCTSCGFIRTNRIAGDDNDMVLFSLAAKPMVSLPFPGERTLEEMEAQLLRGGSYGTR